MCLRRHLFKRWCFYLPYVIGALLLTATEMPAATITVTNGNDSGPGSLRQAIIAASPGDTITFAPSVTTVTLTSGELVINKNLIISGPGATRLTVTAEYTDYVYFRIINISSSTVTVSISGITISNGFAQSGPGGGGILSAGVLRLTGCTLSDNFADGQYGDVLGGGGVMNDNGIMTITGCTISNNGADVSIGGGGVLNENGTMTITGSTISNNDATPPTWSYDDSNGGGISNHSGSLSITNSTISGNRCSAYNGDPLFPAAAFAFGGGIDNSGSLTITNCTMSGNSAVAGGVSNSDTGYGGGISNGGNLQITSSTIAHNSASGDDFGVGGGINGFEPTRMGSSIIALNTASTGGPDYFTNGGELQSTGYNIIGNNADAVINSQPTDQIGTPAAPIDPLLGPLANNGGPTKTHTLLLGSPAIDKGNSGGLYVDQRRFHRPIDVPGIPNAVGGDGSDIGAFEFGSFLPRADFNVDGYPDYVLYNISTRQTAVWYLHNNIYQNAALGPSLPPGWMLIDVADFNGDSHPDYVLFNPNTHATVIWYLNNNVYLNSASGPPLPSGWQVVGTGDFNSDGKPDYALYHAGSRRTAIWYLNNNVYVAAAYGPTLPADWNLVGLADFNSDGKIDYLLFNSITRRSAIWYLNNNVYVGSRYGPTLTSGWQLRGTADYNRDGHPDYALDNVTTLRSAIWYLNNNVYIGGAYGPTLTAGWTLVAP